MCHGRKSNWNTANFPISADGGATNSAGGVMTTLSLNGSLIHQMTPPANWRPLQASNAELRAYGFPVRPTDPALLAHWKVVMGAWKRTAPPGMCATNKRNGLTHTANSPNWAGGFNESGSPTRNEYTTSEGSWVQPGFVSSAPCDGSLGPSAYSIWAGLGGWNSGRLTQEGTDTGTGTNDIYPWWEALDPAHPNPEVRYATNIYVPAPGDDVDAYTSYSGGILDFFVEDLTNGTSWNSSFSSYKGDPASAYYEGTTSDFITEAPSGGREPGGLYALRKPTSAPRYYFASSNGESLSYYYSWRIDEGVPIPVTRCNYRPSMVFMVGMTHGSIANRGPSNALYSERLARKPKHSGTIRIGGCRAALFGRNVDDVWMLGQRCSKKFNM